MRRSAERPRLAVKEADVLRACTDLLTAEGILWFRMNSGAMFGSHKGKKWAVKFGTKGMADVIAFRTVNQNSGCHSPTCWCADTRVLWLEIKAPKGVQSAEQKAFQQLVESHGHQYLLIRDVDQLRDWLRGK